jgi:hypothetical protein
MPAVSNAAAATEPASAGASYSRPLLIGSTLALIALLVVNIPPFLHTALDCDPILFNLYARDMGRGKVLYRDMVENNTPTMIAIQSLIRMAFGHSTFAMRAVDLLVVGFGIGLLARWFRAGRSDLHLFAFALLALLYLSTTEWCHVQRDVWLLAPVMLALAFRRQQILRLSTGRSVFYRAVFEGVVWGLAVWLKPYALVVGAAVWIAGAAWLSARGLRVRHLLADAAGLLLGGSLIGAAGIGVMHAFGIWQPYIAHLTSWGAEYRGADLYGNDGPWFFRLGFVIRNAPWSLIYMIMIPAAAVMTIQSISIRSKGSLPADNGEGLNRMLLAAALTGWAFQACCMQHVFDYPHIVGELFALAILIEIAASQPTIARRRLGLAGIVLIAFIGHANLFTDRVKMWEQCVRIEDRPALRDRLARFHRIGWVELEDVNQFLRGQGAKPGETTVVSDNALPLWEMLDQTPPTRYYIVLNNTLSFRSHKAEIFGALSDAPNLRFLVCDLSEIRWNTPIIYDYSNPGAWPLREDWYGPRRWADRVVFRSGRYVVVAMTGAEIPQWMADVTDN